MRTPRVLVARAAPGELIDLPPEEAHHLARVLRRRAGDPVVLIAGEGDCFQGVVEAVEAATGRGPGGARVKVRVGGPVPPGPRTLPWTVAVALVRSADMDLAVRLGSELGLEGLAPLLCERGQVRERSGRPERWERIAREAAKQCGRAEPLRVGAPLPLGEALSLPFERRFIARPGGPAATPADLAPSGRPVPSLFLVGPEGGFSEGEARAADEAGVRTIGFPTPVLRTPTCVLLIAALGALLASGEGSGEPLPADGAECG